jgi:hypothetical protein
LRFGFIRDRARFRVQLPRLAFVGGEVFFQLLDGLARAAQGIRLAVEALVAMTAHAAALLKEVFAFRQHVRALQHAVGGMALLATRFHVVAFVERVQPEAMPTVSFDDARRRTTVSAVATRTPEAFGL